MNCPNCGELLPNNISVCGKCGKALPTAPLSSRPDTAAVGRAPNAPLQLLRPSEIALMITTIGETIFAQVDQYVLIGRQTPEANYPMLDLAAYSHYSQTISRRHAALYFKDGTLRVRDLQSRNGTWVNGTRLPESGSKTLAPGDMISVGDVDFYVYF